MGKARVPEADLLIFRGKIEGKSTFTRGVFIVLNDISGPARDAITRGKAPSFFVINGHDLVMILSEAISLTDFLRKRVRLLAEEGSVLRSLFGTCIDSERTKTMPGAISSHSDHRTYQPAK